MKKIKTSVCIAIQKILPAFFIAVISISANAQGTCENETALFLENFGTGTTSTSHPDIIPTALTYQDTGSLAAEGVYRVINNTRQKPEWHDSPDHTGDMNGKMLVINGKQSAFYRHHLDNSSGFSAGLYSASLYIMNVNKLPTCGANAVLPTITFSIEYKAPDNSWVSLTGSPITAASVPQTVSPAWIHLGGIFTLPATGSFTVQTIRLTLTDGPGFCGNDYAIDDIKLSACASGGPVPVRFMSVGARQKGSGVNVSWSTASETNNKYFDVEKSIDGGANWTLVATAQTRGNSNSYKNYSAYDAKPFAGVNYYRIKQVDIDGKYKYSSMVTVNVAVDGVTATVLTNPIVTEISIDFFSSTRQTVSLSLFDMAGKLVGADRLIIPKGDSRRSFAKVRNLQKGTYIIDIRDQNGTLIYNGKLIR